MCRPWTWEFKENSKEYNYRCTPFQYRKGYNSSKKEGIELMEFFWLLKY